MEHTTGDERGPAGPEEEAVASAVENVNEANEAEADNNNTSLQSSEVEDASDVTGALPPRKDRPISGVVPPYWRHQRAASRASFASVASSKPAITLEDHSEDPDASSTRGLWAKDVTIDDYAVVSGKTGIGAYVVWMCRVQTLDVRTLPNKRGKKELTYRRQGGPMVIRMRYSEFDELRQLLARAFPHSTNALPPLPPKSVLFKFRPKFLESRRVGLQYFLNCVLLNPEFSGAPVLKDFLFSHVN
jgi:PX domain